MATLLLVIRWNLLQVSASIPAILNDVFPDFSQVFQGTRPVFFRIQVTDHPPDTVKSELLKRALSESEAQLSKTQ